MYRDCNYGTVNDNYGSGSVSIIKIVSRWKCFPILELENFCLVFSTTENTANALLTSIARQSIQNKIKRFEREKISPKCRQKWKCMTVTNSEVNKMKLFAFWYIFKL